MSGKLKNNTTIYLQVSTNILWTWDGEGIFTPGKRKLLFNQVDINVLLRHKILFRIGLL